MLVESNPTNELFKTSNSNGNKSPLLVTFDRKSDPYEHVISVNTQIFNPLQSSIQNIKKAALP